MTESTIETPTTEIQAPAPQPRPLTPIVYPMSREGSRQAVILLLGVVSIWLFALWTLVAQFDGGLSGAEWVTALLMLGILLVSPIVAWALWEEANVVITTDGRGITYQTTGGVSLTYDWSDLSGIKPKGAWRRSRLAKFFLGDDLDELDISTGDAARKSASDTTGLSESDEETEPEHETVYIAVREDAAQLPNPVLRFLHRQAHGNNLPIYGGLENRDALLAEINERAGSSDQGSAIRN